MPASISTLFCTGAVTSAANAPVAQASAALREHREHAARIGGIGLPGVTGAASGWCQTLDDAGRRCDRRGVVVAHTAAATPMRAARRAEQADDRR